MLAAPPHAVVAVTRAVSSAVRVGDGVVGGLLFAAGVVAAADTVIDDAVSVAVAVAVIVDTVIVDAGAGVVAVARRRSARAAPRPAPRASLAMTFSRIARTITHGACNAAINRR